MTENKKHLNELQEELSHYKKNLATIKASFKGKASKDAEKIYGSVKNMLGDASEAYEKLEAASAAEWEPLKKIANNSFKDLKKSFEEYKNIASAQVKDYSNQIEAFSEEQLDHAAEYVKENPLKSILLAGAVGFIVGRILK
ncbi:MAG: hypothetical protein FJX03_04075 [Alphaproteobacteria bacterium]|jgi:ElaB/YqjD/DUF883 family membrane-anchored ribosome-binding protein|nr:hypothetical protein [Alphaproteobacteria bacterium]